MRNNETVSGSNNFPPREFASPSNTFEAESGAQYKVLIFSRDPDLRMLLKTLLGIWRIQTVESDSPENAILKIENEKPQLIILDTLLPFETNLEHIRNFRRHKFSKEMPIIVLSGFSQPEFKRLSLAVGADGFLVKPIDLDALESCLNKNLGQNNEKLQQ